MPGRNSRVRTSWKKKAAPMASVKLHTRSPEGLSDLAIELSTVEPGQARRALRRYQDRWCQHDQNEIARVKSNETLKIFFCCQECGMIEVSLRSAY